MNTYSSRTGKILVCIICITLILSTCFAFAATDVQAASGKGKTVVFKPKKNNGSYNFNELNKLLKNKKVGTIIIKKGSKVPMNGMLRAQSNKTLICTGCTLTFAKDKSGINNTPKKADYSAIKNFKVVGGKWRSKEKGGMHNPMISISNGTNITLDGLDIETNCKSHSIEICSCKNVVIRNCKLRAKGSMGSDMMQEQLQIDVATKKTMPRLAKLGAKYVKGQTCQNVLIENNDITGPVAVRINWYKTHKNHYHKNVVIRNNKLVSYGSEALAVFNTAGVVVENNTITYKGTRRSLSDNHTRALHIQAFGNAPDAFAAANVEINSNTVTGGKNAIWIFEKTDNGKKYCNVALRNNTMYCKSGAANCYSPKEIGKVTSGTVTDVNNTTSGI